MKDAMQVLGAFALIWLLTPLALGAALLAVLGVVHVLGWTGLFVAVVALYVIAFAEGGR